MAASPDSRGLILVDKSQGWTSHDVVARLRRIAETKRVGHAGTLDPMATGLLVLGIGQGTRLLTYLVGLDKTYEATIRLGQATVTDDAEGEIIASEGARGLILAEIDSAIDALRGDIQQVPSSVSAIKVDGKRSYARVRGGEDVTLPARPVHIARFTRHGVREHLVDGMAVTDVDVVVECSSGTYIRALARDLGAALGVGGHLTALRRTRVGAFSVADAASVELLGERKEAGESLRLMSLTEVAARLMPTRELDEDEATAVGHGKQIQVMVGGDQPVAAVRRGELLALLDESGDRAKSLIVFPPRSSGGG